MKRTRISLVIVGVLMVLAIAIGVALAQSQPEYFVDGARGSSDAGVQSTANHPACVPYSADRPDVLVCGPNAPSDYLPPPAPYYDMAICASAMDWLTKNGNPASIDPASCLVQQTMNGDNWMVLFKSRNGDSGVGVPYDPTGEDGKVAHS